ncbi:MAG: sigma 54-interacting transcriptional regulator [Hyphomicrobiales bacterium]
MRPKTLRSTLLLAIAVIVLVSGILISQLVTHRYSASLIEGAVAQAQHVAHKLALDSAEQVLTNDLVGLQRMLDGQIAANPAVSYIFIIRDARVLSHTFQAGVPVELIAANAVEDSEAGHVEKIISDKGERFLDIAWPIFGGRAGMLRMGFSEEPYRKKVGELWVQMSLITLAVLVVSLIAGQLFVFRLTRPLLRLADQVEEIGEDNLAQPVWIKGRVEISRLAAAFNRMLERLKDYTDRLQTSNRQLEKTNEELDRAQRQLRTSLAISREIAALPALRDVSLYLIKTFKSIIACRNMALLVFSSDKDEAFLTHENGYSALGSTACDSAFSLISGQTGIGFFQQERLAAVPLPSEMQGARRLAVLPFRHQNELLGAMLIGCPSECTCVTNELEVIDLILGQTSGALRRGILHEEEIRNLRSRIEPTAEFSGLIGKDPKMQVIYKLIEDVAPTDATVLIQGESGTGKELVARAIHEQSPRNGRPFVVINCSAYPSTLLESELFGHEKGAFTGASRRRAGRFEQAHGGTVFLDEIGEISQTAQIKLLRVLQSQKFERLGGEQTLTVDVRILAATNKNLLEQVKAGQFREDLFYRLNVIPVQLPPLRDRENDIPVLARHFLRVFAERQKKDIREFSTEAMRALLNYQWPGNVRELENTIEHAVVLAKGQAVEAVDLPPGLMRPAPEAAPPPSKTITDNEARLLREVLEECNWNKTEAALRLGISRSTLYEKIRKYQLNPPTVH